MVGLPFFVVSTSAPLLQKWFSHTGHQAAADPYFLYGASNMGSMLSLVLYPFLVEPLLGLSEQSWTWTGGYVLLLLLYRTRLGLATRAVSQQPTAAELCGISITGVNVLTFAVTGVVGGIAGAMTGAAIGMLSPLLSLPLTVKGLIVTVIGGLGSIPGAIIAGLVVGALENVFQFFRGVSERDLYIMLLLFAFLVFRPGGLMPISAGRD